MTSLQIVALVVATIIFSFIVRKTNFAELTSSKKVQHRVFGCSTALFVLWIFRVSIYEGLWMHFLGLTAFTLILGFRWATIAATGVLLLYTVLGYERFTNIGVNAILGVYLPICLSYCCYILSFHKLPKNVFIYLFTCAFFPAALSIIIKMLSMSVYYWVEGFYTWDVIEYNYTQMIILLMFQEALFNGMVMTCLVVYKPNWIYTYSDKFYLDGK